MKSQGNSPEVTEWIKYINGKHQLTIDLTLDRIRAVAQKGKLNILNQRVITVAGTNGKGTTCALLERVLLESGYSVGLFTSPPLINQLETVKINDVSIEEGDYLAALSEIDKLCEDVTLTLFEYETLAAIYLFKKAEVDFIILEVGLGGRNDATNIFDADISIITTLDKDHTDILSDDLEKIGYEKSGIFRPQKIAICGEPNPPKSIEYYAREIDSVFYQVGKDFNYHQHGRGYWSWESNKVKLPHLPVPTVPMMNAGTALMALHLLDISIEESVIASSLRSVFVPGRYQVIKESGKPVTVLDVAHNPHAAKYLIQKLNTDFPNATFKIVFGMLKNKDIPKTSTILNTLDGDWYPTLLPTSRTASQKDIIQHLPNTKDVYLSPTEAYVDACNDAKEQDVIIVVGSFFTVSSVIESLEGNESPDNESAVSVEICPAPT